MLQWATSNDFCCGIKAGGLKKNTISLYKFSVSRSIEVVGIVIASQSFQLLR